MKKMIGCALPVGVMAALALVPGCFTRGEAYTKKTMADGTVVESRASIFGTGDKAASVAAEGLFADGTQEDLGAGFKSANAMQQSSGIDGSLAGSGNLLSGVAQLVAVSQRVSVPSTIAPTVSTNAPVASPFVPAVSVAASPNVAPADSTTANAALAAKVADAKAEGKPLVVVAGSPACGYSVRLNTALDASALPGRTDIVLYREMSGWSANSALAWTGGGRSVPCAVIRMRAAHSREGRSEHSRCGRDEQFPD